MGEAGAGGDCMPALRAAHHQGWANPSGNQRKARVSRQARPRTRPRGRPQSATGFDKALRNIMLSEAAEYHAF